MGSMGSLEGFLNLDKPAGLTSHDCVAVVRRVLRTRQVGHGGTLDPAATGVLPIAVGRATRFLAFLPATSKGQPWKIEPEPNTGSAPSSPLAPRSLACGGFFPAFSSANGRCCYENVTFLQRSRDPAATPAAA
jgi:hypothetical protein